MTRLLLGRAGFALAPVVALALAAGGDEPLPRWLPLLALGLYGRLVALALGTPREAALPEAGRAAGGAGGAAAGGEMRDTGSRGAAGAALRQAALLPAAAAAALLLCLEGSLDASLLVLDCAGAWGLLLALEALLLPAGSGLLAALAHSLGLVLAALAARALPAGGLGLLSAPPALLLAYLAARRAR